MLAADDPAKFVAAVEMTTLFNVNLTTKLAVQYSLWGGTVMNLRTERHHGVSSHSFLCFVDVFVDVFVFVMLLYLCLVCAVV